MVPSCSQHTKLQKCGSLRLDKQQLNCRRWNRTEALMRARWWPPFLSGSFCFLSIEDFKFIQFFSLHRQCHGLYNTFYQKYQCLLFSFRKHGLICLLFAITISGWRKANLIWFHSSLAIAWRWLTTPPSFSYGNNLEGWCVLAPLWPCNSKYLISVGKCSYSQNKSSDW